MESVMTWDLVRRDADNEYDVIPSSWVIEDKIALYPFLLSEQEVKRLAKEGAKANPDWEKIKIHVIQRNYETYDSCLKDAVRKQQGKKLLSESLVEPKGVGQRKGVSSYKDILSNINCASINIPSDKSKKGSSRKATKPKADGNAPGKTRKDDRQVDKRKAEVPGKIRGNDCKVDKRKVDVPGKIKKDECQASKSKADVPGKIKKDECQASKGKADVPGKIKKDECQAKKGKTDNQGKIRENNLTKQGTAPLQENVCSNETSDDSYPPECPLTSNQYHYCAVKQPATLLSLGQHGCRLSYSLQIAKSNCNGHWKEAVGLLKSIDNKLRTGSMSNEALLEDEPPKPKKIDSFPLTSLEQVKEFEEELSKTEGLFKKIVLELINDTSKTKKLEKQSRKACKKIITQAVAANYTWDGALNEKLCFKDTKLVELIYEVTKFFWKEEVTSTKFIKEKMTDTLRSHLSECGTKEKKKSQVASGTENVVRRRRRSSRSISSTRSSIRTNRSSSRSYGSRRRYSSSRSYSHDHSPRYLKSQSCSPNSQTSHKDLSPESANGSRAIPNQGSLEISNEHLRSKSQESLRPPSQHHGSRRSRSRHPRSRRSRSRYHGSRRSKSKHHGSRSSHSRYPRSRRSRSRYHGSRRSKSKHHGSRRSHSRYPRSRRSRSRYHGSRRSESSYHGSRSASRYRGSYGSRYHGSRSASRFRGSPGSRYHGSRSASRFRGSSGSRYHGSQKSHLSGSQSHRSDSLSHHSQSQLQIPSPKSRSQSQQSTNGKALVPKNNSTEDNRNENMSTNMA